MRKAVEVSKDVIISGSFILNKYKFMTEDPIDPSRTPFGRDPVNFFLDVVEAENFVPNLIEANESYRITCGSDLQVTLRTPEVQRGEVIIDHYTTGKLDAIRALYGTGFFNKGLILGVDLLGSSKSGSQYAVSGPIVDELIKLREIKLLHEVAGVIGEIDPTYEGEKDIGEYIRELESSLSDGEREELAFKKKMKARGEVVIGLRHFMLTKNGVHTGNHGDPLRRYPFASPPYSDK